MFKAVLILVLSLAFLSCEKTLQDVPENEIPDWLKTKISQDEVKIGQNPKYLTSWGAWIRYKWQKEYFFEYHNVLSSSSVAPVSESGDTLYYGATNLNYYNEKCCKQYVWKAPKYKEY
jgi:hypothetical protein